jgi:hypothetical protein
MGKDMCSVAGINNSAQELFEKWVKKYYRNRHKRKIIFPDGKAFIGGHGR